MDGSREQSGLIFFFFFFPLSLFPIDKTLTTLLEPSVLEKLPFFVSQNTPCVGNLAPTWPLGTPHPHPALKKPTPSHPVPLESSSPPSDPTKTPHTRKSEKLFPFLLDPPLPSSRIFLIIFLPHLTIIYLFYIYYFLIHV